jgi:hypothetical protein
MTNEHNTSNVRVSNWTLATGTRPGERYVYAATSNNAHVRAVVPGWPPDRNVETSSR